MTPHEVYLVYVDGILEHVCLDKVLAESIIREYEKLNEFAYLRVMPLTTK